MAQPVTSYARARDGVHIAYQIAGSGPHDLIEVPGFVSNIEAYTEMPNYALEADHFESFARWIRLDKRGTGQSDRVAEAPSLETRMDDVRAVMDAAGSERAFLYGISEGGPMCLLFAATYPERTAGLVILGSFARMFREPGYDIGFPESVAEVNRDFVEAHWGDGSSLTAFVPEYVEHHPEAVPVLARYERQSASPGAVRDILDLIPQIDVRPVLPSITVPTLVIHTARDPMVPVELGRYLAEHIPGARMSEPDLGDHLPLGDDYVPVLDAIEEFVTGTRPVSSVSVDRALATVLFTDIVASTERDAVLGDAEWRSVLDRHDALTRTEVDRHRGREIKHTGDGFFATFDGPARAVRCAQAIEQEIAVLGIQVRAGVHTGEVELRGDDVGGIAVHIGARVAAMAGPSEVLVTRTVKDLVAGSGLRFADRGEHELKGVPDCWQIYAVEAEVGAPQS